MSAKQGIVTILGSDTEKNKSASIRRTLSADMSSKKWFQQNGFLSQMKKISNVSSDHEDFDKNPPQDDVWKSIQAEKERNVIQEPSWGSILTQKSESCLLPPPYVPPEVKRSSSTLSEKSLEVCTESLGSESGSECYNSENSSDGDGDEDKEDSKRVVLEDDPYVDFDVVKYKKSPARSFPPPIASIGGGDGAALHMQSRRENGRLVLEAVAAPSRNYFHARRGEGRLVLTLARNPIDYEEFEKVFDDMEEVDDDVRDCGGYEEDKLEGIEQKSRSLPSGVIGMHKSRILMKKLVAIGNKNPTWSKKVEYDEEVSIPQSLPSPPPRVGRLIPPTSAAASASFNAYDYFWRNKFTASATNATTIKNSYVDNKNTKTYEHQDLVLVKGNKAEYFVPYLKGCKEGRRSLLIWEPYCIATS